MLQHLLLQGLDKLLPALGLHNVEAVPHDLYIHFLGLPLLLLHPHQYVLDALLYGGRSDAVLGVVGLLDGAAALGLGYCLGHCVGGLVGIHDHLAVHVPGGSSYGLYQGGGRAEESDLVCIHYCDKGDLGDIKALPQQVYSNQHVALSGAEFLDYLHTLEGLDLRVHVAHLEVKGD